MSALSAPVSASMSLLVNAAPMAHAAPQSAPADNGFARCLDQAREHGNDDDAPADEAPPRTSVRRPPPNARAERDARAGRAASTAETPPKKTDGDTEAQTDTATSDTAHDDASAPDLAALLPGWAPPAAAAPTVTATANDDAPLQASVALGGVNVPKALPQDEAAARASAQLTATPANAAANDKSAAAIATTPGAELQAAASEQRSAAPDLQSAPLPTALHGAPAAATTTTFRTADAAQPTAALPAPIDSPAFAPSLATQLRWWASDGVQQAQLLLNPAEMGPVAVKILLDGREARIDFSADLAATRGAIEAALPVLAAALDDGGLKLTGGGVHDGSAQHQPEWSARGVTQRTVSGSDEGDTAAPAAVTQQRAIARGMVDLVA
jgi:flagellar hook-length control protein FliK